MSMIYDGIEYFPVTTEPTEVARLRAQGLDSIDLARWAVDHGFTPPEYEDGQPIPAIVEIYPPDMDDGVLIWDVHDMEVHEED